MNSKIKSLLSDTFVFAIGNTFSKLVLFFLMPFYTTMLDVSEYGIADTLNNFVELLIPLSTVCISEAVFRFLIDYPSNNFKILKSGLYINIFGCTITSLLLILTKNIFSFYWVWYVIILLWSQVMRQYLGYILRGLGKSKEFAFSGFFTTVVLVICNIVFLKYLNYRVEGYLLSIIIANILTVILSVFFLKNIVIKKNISSEVTIKSMLTYSLPIVPNNVSWWINTASSRYVLLYFIGSSSTGMYAAASKLPSIINMLASIFQQAWMYSASKVFNDDVDSKNNFYSLVFKYYSLFLNLSCSFVIFVIPVLSKYILKENFYLAWKFVPILLVSACLGAYSVFFGGLYAASMNNKIVMYSTFIGSVVNIVLSVVLVPKLGIHGVTIASLFCYLIIVIYRYFDTRKFILLDVSYLKIMLSFAIIILQSLSHIFIEGYNLQINLLLFLLLVFIYIKDLSELFKTIFLILGGKTNNS